MITRLGIHNFKIFESQEFILPQLTLLTGINGVGKSTVIQSLLLLRQSFQQQFLQKGGLALNGNLVQIGTGQDALFDGVRTSDEIGFDLDVEGQPSVFWRFAYDMTSEVLKTTIENSTNFVYLDSSLFNDQFQYLQAERIGPRTSFEMSEYSVRTQRQIGIQGEYTAHFLDSYQEMSVIPSLEHPDAVGNSLRHQVEAWMTEISPGIRLDLEAFRKMGRMQVGISVVRGSDVSNSYRPTNVGFGIIYVLPILVALLSSLPQSLVIIENPEAHLHPRGQVKMGELMARAAAAGVQVICETHSDHILNGVRLAVKNQLLQHDQVALNFFSREEGNVKVEMPELDEEGRLDYRPEGFFDEYSNSMRKLM